MASSRTIRLGDRHILYVRQSRSEHERECPMTYRGRCISSIEAELTLERILESDDRVYFSNIPLNYAMCEMLKAITKHDEEVAISYEEKDDWDELMLSAHVTLTQEPLSTDIRYGISKLLRDDLGNTGEEHLTEAQEAAFPDFTLESLRYLRCRIGGLNEEEMDLLMNLTWSRSTPQLARGLNLK